MSNDNQENGTNATRETNPRKDSKKLKSACCWCETIINCHLIGEDVILKMSKPHFDDYTISAIEYCPKCDNINLLTELPCQADESDTTECPTCEGGNVDLTCEGEPIHCPKCKGTGRVSAEPKPQEGE